VQDHFLQFSVRDRHKAHPKLADLQRCTQFAADHVAILFNGPQVPTLSEQGLELVRSMPICDFTMVWESFLQHVNTSKLRKYPAVATKFVEVTLTTLRSYSSSSMGYVQLPYFTRNMPGVRASEVIRRRRFAGSTSLGSDGLQGGLQRGLQDRSQRGIQGRFSASLGGLQSGCQTGLVRASEVTTAVVDAFTRLLSRSG
jgi:hypothetical protein